MRPTFQKNNGLNVTIDVSHLMADILNLNPLDYSFLRYRISCQGLAVLTVLRSLDMIYGTWIVINKRIKIYFASNSKRFSNGVFQPRTCIGMLLERFR